VRGRPLRQRFEVEHDVEDLLDAGLDDHLATQRDGHPLTIGCAHD
jgi:hypothetical protein